VSDDNQAMLGAITKKFPDSTRQRCEVHKTDNVRSLVRTKQEQLKPALKALFYLKVVYMAEQLSVTTERVDNIPTLLTQSEMMGLPENRPENDRTMRQ
jgi:hypothetical protein